MSQTQQLETEINKLTPEQQYLVRECAHQMRQVLDRYQRPATPQPTVLALDLVAAQLTDSIRY